jgi:hypothetical protein
MKTYVVGFCQGSRMVDELGMLHSDSGQKHIRHWILTENEPFDQDVFGAYLMEAEELQKMTKPFSKKYQ